MICSSDASEDLDKRHDPSEKARELLNEGLHVFPVEPRGKKPLVNWAEYQHRPPTQEEFENWCERFPGCNWGIATGLRLIVVDADTDEGVAFMLSGEVPRSRRQVITAKGRHFYYAGDASITNSQGDHIDVRGMGGYVVAPGSVHESGHVYREIWA